MNHVLIGALFPFLAAALLYLWRRGRASLTLLMLTPIAMGLGALWAVLPDIPRLLGMMNLYFRLAADPRTNICFWHHTLDRLETDSPAYMAGVVLMVLALFAAAWRELYLEEKR